MSSGFCGESLMWWIEGGDTLIISGTGQMNNYTWNDYYRGVNSPWWGNRRVIKKIIIYDGVTSISKYAFYDCPHLTSVTIPDSVTSIGDWAFTICKNLKDITIPESVMEIGRGIFSGCISLTEITIPKGVTSIGDLAFNWCTSLTEIYIPEGVTSIGRQPFSNCTSLKEIYYPAGNGFEKFLSQGNNAKLIPYIAAPIPYTPTPPPAQIKPSKPANEPKPANERKFFPVVEPASEKLRWKVEGKTLTVGGVREIQFYRYGELPWVRSVDKIQHIVIEEGVEKISANAFSECTRLELLTIPASVKTIGDCAFTFCYCGVNNGKNVIWSLDDGVLTFKKNPAARNAADFSIGVVSWRAVDKNISSVKLERDVIPDKKFFDWRKSLSRDVPVSM